MGNQKDQLYEKEIGELVWALIREVDNAKKGEWHFSIAGKYIQAFKGLLQKSTP